MKQLDITLYADMFRSLKIGDANEVSLGHQLKVVQSCCVEMVSYTALEYFRLYLGNATLDKDFHKNLVMKITSKDKVFPQENNASVLRVFAGAVLYAGLTRKVENPHMANLISTALSIVVFQEKEIVNPTIFVVAETILSRNSSTLRNQLNSNHNDLIDGLSDKYDERNEAIPEEGEGDEDSIIRIDEQMSDLVSGLTNLLRKQQQQILALSEESNVHWWLFRRMQNRSSEKNSGKEDVSAFEIVIDLIKQTSLFPWAHTAKEIIESALRHGDDPAKEISVKDAILGASQSELEMVIRPAKKEIISGICPLIEAIFLWLDNMEDIAMWVGSHKKIYGSMLERKVSLNEFAYQLFRELSFVNYLSGYGS